MDDGQDHGQPDRRLGSERVTRDGGRERPEQGSGLLVANRLCKRFGGVQVLSDVSFTITKGDIYGLIGPNNAGKTTLLNIMTGLYVPEAGTCYFTDRELTRLNPHQIEQAGLARTFQNVRMFSALSALENVMIGGRARPLARVFGAVFRSRRARIGKAVSLARARELLEYVGLSERAGHMAGTLPHGEQRRLDIARALASGPSLLVLDEPAAGMDASAIAALRRLIEKIRDDGVTMVLIEHDMELVMGLCNRVLVLDAGKVLAEGEPAQLRRNPKVIKAYPGAAF